MLLLYESFKCGSGILSGANVIVVTVNYTGNTEIILFFLRTYIRIIIESIYIPIIG